jgi:tetratricopeptide (TPR) repeat protein
MAYVALAVNGLAALDGDQNRMEEARKGFEEALQIYRQLANNNPDVYLPEVARTLTNLAVLDVDQNRRKDARKGLEEALEIYERFAKRNPRFQPDVARVKLHLGTLSK